MTDIQARDYARTVVAALIQRAIQADWESEEMNKSSLTDAEQEEVAEELAYLIIELFEDGAPLPRK